MPERNDLLIGQIALEKGLVSPERLREALQEQARESSNPRPLGSILVAKGSISESQLAQIIDEHRRRMDQPADYAQTRHEDLLLGKLLVRQGHAREDQVNTALRRQQELAEEGTVKRLGEILVETGAADAEAVKQTLKVQNKTLMLCPSCHSRYNVAGYSAAKTYECRKCGTGLALVSSPTAVTKTADASLVDTRKPAPGETVPSTAAPPKPEGKPFGKYTLVQRIGEGGFGAVYKAWQEDLRRYVALKGLSSDNSEDIARFTREARLAATLNHPNIVPIYEVGEVDEKRYLTMELIDGSTLDGLQMPPRQAAEVMRDAAVAVHYAHEKGIIHRDLKPKNLMLDRQGRVRVMDFGLAREMSKGSTLTMSGAIVGSPSYMSPEQAGGRRCDARSDVYSLGATLYEVLTASAPFEGKEPMEVVRRVLSDDPIPPRKLKPSVPADLETIVLKCLEKDPDRRYATALEFAEDLRRYLSGEPIAAHPPSTFYKLYRRVAKRKAVVAVGAAGLAAVIAVTAIWVPRWRREKAKVEQARLEKEKSEREHAEQLRLQNEAAQKRETDLKTLSALWTQIVLAKSRLCNPSEDPARVRSQISTLVDEVSGYIEGHPDQPQGYYIRARGRLYLEDLDAAEGDLIRAVGIDESFAPGQALLGRVKLEQHNLRIYCRPEDYEDRRKAAAPLLEEARRRLAKGWRTGSKRHSIETWGLAKTPEDDVAEVVTEAMVAYDVDGEKDRATDILKRAIRNDASEEYYHLLGALALPPAEKIEWESKAIERMPHFAKAYLERGSAYWLLGKQEEALRDYDQALRDYDQSLRINPRSAAAYFNRAGLRRDLGKVDAAVDDLEKAVEFDPKMQDAWQNLGAARLARGEWTEAARDFDKVLDLDPRYARAFLGRGMARAGANDQDGAIRDFDRALELNPGLADARCNRGLARWKKGDAEAALRDFDEALRIKPDFAEALVNRGNIRQAQGNPEEALKDFDKAVGLAPKMPEAFVGRGYAHEELAKRQQDRAREHLAQAVADVEKALQIAPPNWGYRKGAEDGLKRLRDELNRVDPHR